MIIRHAIRLAVVAILFSASSLTAGTFVMLRVTIVDWPIDANSSRLFVTGRAQYQGPLDSNDRNWGLQTFLEVDHGPEQSGFGINGTSIPYSGYIVDCDISCGPDVVVPHCSAGMPSDSRGRGVVAIYHQYFPEINVKYSVRRLGPCDLDPPTPIILDLGPRGFDLVGLGQAVEFDIDADGSLESIGWTSAESLDAFLALDRNGDLVINDGSELFGNATPLPGGGVSAHGYEALGVLDRVEEGGNANGRIDPGDDQFSQLRLWIDSDHDGLSQSQELFSLGDLAVEWISLDFFETRRMDEHGNLFKYMSRALVGGQARWASDVYFVIAD